LHRRQWQPAGLELLKAARPAGRSGALIVMTDPLFFARRELGSPVQTVTPPDFIRSPTYVRRRRAVVMMSEPATGVHRVHRVHRRIMMRP
jgi:hypothetical protein